MEGCFESGRVIVLPLPKGPQLDSELIIETADQALGDHDHDQKQHLRLSGPVPTLLAVEPGTEQQSCTDLLKGGKVQAASPNFYLSPSSPVRFAEAAFSALLDELGAWHSPRPTAGPAKQATRIKVAVLDSGWANPDGKQPNAGVREYYADRPPTPGATADATGHGTTVIEIVRRLAPNADVRSFRIYDRVGTFWALLSGLLLAEAAFSPHLINLSLSLKCETKSCAYCRRAGVSLEQLSLLFWAFRRQRQGPAPAIVAAAGNNERRCALPAGIEGVIAVGAFDRRTGAPSVYSQYEAVPAGRFVMAPGGSADPAAAFAFARTGMTGRNDAPLYGTSFAAPCITGLAAKYLEERICPACSEIHAPNDYGQMVLDYLAATSDRAFRGYDVGRHGLGAARYRCGLRESDVDGALARLIGLQTARIRDLVSSEAEAIYEERGTPQDQAQEHWWLARERCGIPATVDV